MNSVKYALAELDNLDQVLEDVNLSRSRHKGIIHSIKVIRDTIIECEMVKNENKELRDKLKKKNNKK